MPYRMAVTSIVTHRDGVRKYIRAGTPFDFTSEEIEHLEENEAIRKLRTEGPEPEAMAAGPFAGTTMGEETATDMDAPATKAGNKKPAARGATRGRDEDDL